MFTYKKAPYKIFALGPKFCWADPDYGDVIYFIILNYGNVKKN